MIAVLYAYADGPYAGLDGVDVWDVARDARAYRGDAPVVAHPPCSRWCCLAGLVEARWGHVRGEDDGCFAHALASVRAFGGVLEHPAYSDARDVARDGADRCRARRLRPRARGDRGHVAAVACTTEGSVTASQTASHEPRQGGPAQGQLFYDAPSVLESTHYLGEIGGKTYADDHGVVVCGSVSSRNLPRAWVELKRWCIVRPARANAGSMMWAGLKAWIRKEYPRATTVVSYSDPTVGHDGALYRACGWLWAPTWHRLRPPPSGGGSWDGVTKSAPKDRWVFPLAEDAALRDESVARRMPWAAYVEPTWRRGVPHGGGGDYRRWRAAGGGA